MLSRLRLRLTSLSSVSTTLLLTPLPSIQLTLSGGTPSMKPPLRHSYSKSHKKLTKPLTVRLTLSTQTNTTAITYKLCPSPLINSLIRLTLELTLLELTLFKLIRHTTPNLHYSVLIYLCQISE